LWLPPHCTKEKQRLAFLFHATVKNFFVIELYSSIPLQNILDSQQHLLVNITGLITSNSNIYDKSEFLQEAQILYWSEELDLTLDSSSGIVQPPVSSLTLQNTEDISSKLALPFDVSPLPDIHENVRSISVKRRPSQCGSTIVVTSFPYENKSA
jgi:hypothetical protein